jgi:phosphate transport system substrate-binding protein
MNRYRLTFLLGILVFSFLCIHLVDEVRSQARKIRISCGSVVTDLANERAKDFKEKLKTCDVDVSITTSGQSIAQLLEGQTELAMPTRDMTADEKAKAAEKSLTVAGELLTPIGIAVIANPTCPVNQLTLEEIRKIFAGYITNWKEVGGPDAPITVATRAVPDTGSGVVFQEIVLKGAQYAKGHFVVKTFGEMVSVCRTSNAIGYLPTSSGYFKQKNKFKEIKVKKSEDSPVLDAQQPDFPISMPCYLFWNAKASDSCISQFVNLCTETMRK